MDWYKDNIEEPIRDLVYELRNNGINTECSCGHRMYIQCQFIDKCGIFDVIHGVLSKKGIKTYQIIMRITSDEGHRYYTLDIQFPDEKGLYQNEIKWNDNFVENKF